MKELSFVANVTIGRNGKKKQYRITVPELVAKKFFRGKTATVQVAIRLTKV